MRPRIPGNNQKLWQYMEAMIAVQAAEGELMRQRQALVLLQNEVLATEIEEMREMLGSPCHFCVTQSVTGQLPNLSGGLSSRFRENLSDAIKRRFSYCGWDGE
jgi:hypothetical protein